MSKIIKNKQTKIINKKEVLDRLGEIFESQKKFQYHFYDPAKISEEEKIKYTKEFILSAHRELGEILNIIPWKLHRKNNKKYNVNHLKEEIIDTIKFILNLCIVWQMTDDELYNVFIKKTNIVEKRYHDEFKK